jgi:hypothetical protein
MMRTAGTLAIVGGIVAWLVFSYWTPAAALLPTIAFGGAWAVSWLPALAAAVLAVAAGIQGWLVYATAQSLRRPAGPVQAAALSHFRLNVRTEAWLTAAPIFITLVLAAWLWLGSR